MAAVVAAASAVVRGHHTRRRRRWRRVDGTEPTLASAVTVVVTAPTAARPVAVRPQPEWWPGRRCRWRGCRLGWHRNHSAHGGNCRTGRDRRLERLVQGGGGGGGGATGGGGGGASGVALVPTAPVVVAAPAGSRLDGVREWCRSEGDGSVVITWDPAAGGCTAPVTPVTRRRPCRAHRCSPADL